MTATAVARLERFDHEVKDLATDYVAVVAGLQEFTKEASSFNDAWRDIDRRLRELRTHLEPADFDKEQLVGLTRALLDIRDLADDRESFDALDELLVRFERLRHIVRDALDEHVHGVSGDTAAVVAELFERLPTASKQQVADLVGIDRRTLARWQLASGGDPAPRLRVVARLVAVLRHNWTSEGALLWFDRPRRELDGRTPRDLIGVEKGPIDEEALLSAARAGRSQYAS